MTNNLRAECDLIISGHHSPTPSQLFSQMAKWCEINNIQHDVYGEGDLIQGFEEKVAKRLGYPAGLFVITGTLTQPTVLDLVCRQKRNKLVGMHETSHILRHENQNYQLQQRFNILHLGNRYRPWTVDDLAACPDELSAVLYELPMREIGGQLLPWEELQAIKAYCKENHIHLHMDGARLWESAAFYEKPYHEIAAGFDTTYVSLYKGLGGLGGSILLGSESFIALAKKWMQRQGGNVYHRTPYVVSAAMQFEERLQQMPALYQRTKEIYALLQAFPQFTLNPVKPQANMLHLILPFSYETAIQLRDQLAREQGVWLGNPQVTGHPHQSMIEWYVGDTLLQLEDQRLIDMFAWLSTKTL